VNRWGKFSAIVACVQTICFIAFMVWYVNFLSSMMTGAFSNIYGGGSSSSSGGCCKGSSLCSVYTNSGKSTCNLMSSMSCSWSSSC
jgi:hypothetical protein